MAAKYNSLGFLEDAAVASGDSATATSYTAAMREQLTNPDPGLICYDPDVSALVFWNGTSWVGVISASSTKTIVNVTANYAMTVDADVIVANAAAGSLIVTLPTVLQGKGREFAVIKSDSSANTVTLQCRGTDVIGEGADTTFVLSSKNDVVKVMSIDSGIWLVS